MNKEEEIEFQSFDELNLKGTFKFPSSKITHAVLLVHGITVNREEDGFYTELSKRLSSAGIMSFRFDLRGHGSSQGTFEKLTLTEIINDIDSAFQELCRKISDDVPVSVVASSFGGGLSACWAEQNQGIVRTLVLLNPLLDYAKRMLFSKPFWDNGRLTIEGVKTLDKQGWLPHEAFRMGKSLINELLYIKPYKIMKNLDIPVLTIHGDVDSIVSFETAKKYSVVNSESSFISIHGADHGFSEPRDEGYVHPNTVKFQNTVFERVVEWISRQNE